MRYMQEQSVLPSKREAGFMLCHIAHRRCVELVCWVVPLLQAAQEGHNAAMSALKQGWAAELKCQAASWEAAAAAKQEAWRVDKVAEIKEQTVKVC